MAHDPYYRQMLEWSKQQAAQQAQRQQEQVNIQRINEERERLRREHLERTRIYEAQLAQSAASSAAGAGAGGHRATTVNNSSSGTIVFNGVQNVSTGSWISAPAATIGTWLPGTGDFTIEWFQYYVDVPAHPRIFSIGVDTTATLGVSIEGAVYTWPNGNNWDIGKTYSNTWVHIAIVRKGGTSSCYIDGIRSLKDASGSTASNGYYADTQDVSGSTKPLYIGSDHATSGDWFQGKITNFRWTNAAVYTGASFSRPTSPLTKLAQTKLLMLGGNITNPVVDSTGINVLTNYNTTWSSDTPFS